MKIAAPDLSKYLSSLKSAYVVSGEDPFLKQEATSLVRKACVSQGFEREVIHIASKEDWRYFYDACSDLSLFSDKKLLELRLPQAKMTAEAEAAILHYLSSPSPDLILLLDMEKFDSAAQKSKWYQALDEVGLMIPVWPVKPEEMLAWVSARARNMGLKLSPALLSVLAERTTGNLLAAHQELEKLALLPKNLTEAELSAAISDQDRYDVFALGDAILQRNAKRALRILASLQAESAEPILVLWALTRELTISENILIAKAQNQNLEFIFKKNAIWPQKQKLVMSYLSHMKLTKVYEHLQLAETIDQTIKGSGIVPVWNLILELVLSMMNCPSVRQVA